MTALRLDGTGVGTGQPGRTDFDGAEHLDNLVPGHRIAVDTSGVPETRNRTTDPTRRQNHWQRQESLVSDNGERRRQRADDWRRFSGGGSQRTNLGAVNIDQPKNPAAVEDGPPPTFTPEQLKNGRWVEMAAHFEETQRETDGRYGAAHELGLPPIEVGESPERNGPGNPKNRRRAFTVG